MSKFEKIMLELEHKKVAANTRRGIRTVLSGVIQYAVRHEIVDHNPVRDLSDIEGTAKKPVAMTAERLSDFLAKLDADKAAVRTFLTTSGSCSERASGSARLSLFDGATST
ncbi:hypothetical protein MOQ72_42850 [Saccharopolyspora sp. K220]|nr:hypothetical protein [Saccharopolyspora soli]MCI2424154.1 hypothetical protein [Saccharopolyspora soli]